MRIIEDPLTQSNCYCLIEGKHLLVIDPNHDKQIEKLIKEKNLCLEYVFLTHEHCDHMQGLNQLRKKYDFITVSTEKCSENIGNPIKNMSRLMGPYLYFKYGEQVEYPYKKIVCEPSEVVFQDTYHLFWEGHEFFFQALPGHTQGSCGIFLDYQFFFSGDYLIAGEDVITRFPGGDEEAYQRKSKPWLEGLGKGTIVYPGHGKKVVI